MKAQAAIEYLTTYSWMILGVSAMAGVAFLSIEDPCTYSKSDFYSNSLELKDYGSSSDEFKLSVKNTEYQKMYLRNITVQIGEENQSKDLKYDLKSSKTRSISVEGFKKSSSCNDLEITISYDRGSLINRTAKALVQSSIEIR